ncbi:MAG: phosphodiester glycosidase family protein [Muribaculaceae bacterium]|nr:phosphodiester glycosidase family protein [Muribaculaceae bacterium]
MKTEQRVIEVTETPRPDDRPVDIPVISIENSSDSSYGNEEYFGATRKQPKQKKNILLILSLLTTILIAGVLLWIFRYNLMETEVPVSVSDRENIEKLQQPFTPTAKGTELISDSVLGVAMEIYPLQGLRASLETELPDTADRTLVLFTRSADYHSDGSLIGTVVNEGRKVNSKERKSRQGYLAISKSGRPVTGVSLSDKVADYTAQNGGSFFRQYVLLGDGELPSSFHLHGKVERAAIARDADDQLYYIVTRHKETMYDFADAMREYGLTDAIYLTGGNSYTFYRDSTGAAHVTDRLRQKYAKYNDTPLPAPLLVFRQ